MKKPISILLALCMLIALSALTACKNSESKTEAESSSLVSEESAPAPETSESSGSEDISEETSEVTESSDESEAESSAPDDNSKPEESQKPETPAKNPITWDENTVPTYEQLFEYFGKITNYTVDSETLFECTYNYREPDSSKEIEKICVTENASYRYTNKNGTVFHHYDVVDGEYYYSVFDKEDLYVERGSLEEYKKSLSFYSEAPLPADSVKYDAETKTYSFVGKYIFDEDEYSKTTMLSFSVTIVSNDEYVLNQKFMYEEERSSETVTVKETVYGIGKTKTPAVPDNIKKAIEKEKNK